jgi:hypothetical protein
MLIPFVVSILFLCCWLVCIEWGWIGLVFRVFISILRIGLRIRVRIGLRIGFGSLVGMGGGGVFSRRLVWMGFGGISLACVCSCDWIMLFYGRFIARLSTMGDTRANHSNRRTNIWVYFLFLKQLMKILPKHNLEICSSQNLLSLYPS